ncbi:MAG: 50S ribosomal protein L28 [Deltaproteobacteria bacterium]|nr:50S ribosomal protein L28 [Deltaproteobacteria bacterium]
MANVCEITGKRRLSGNTVSHANNRHRMVQHPNIQERAFFVPELKVRIRLRLSRAGLRLIDKSGGLARYVRQTDPTELSPALRQLRKALTKPRKTAARKTA